MSSSISTSTDATTETLDANTCPGTDLGTISKTEIRCYGYGDGNDQITLNGTALTMPSSAGWSSYVDVGITTWTGVVNLNATVQYNKSGKANTMYGSKVEIRVTWGAPPPDIDIGAAANDRPFFWDATFTAIALDNPANESGTITNVEIWAVNNISDCKVGTFYEGATGYFTCRDYASIGSVIAGSKQIFNGLSIACVAGDYIGIYGSAGQVERDQEGYAGLRWKSGDQFDVGEQLYSLMADDCVSVYGYGDIGAPPPVTQYLAGNDCPVFPHEKDLLSGKLPCPL